jgi:hypothetical protein
LKTFHMTILGLEYKNNLGDLDIVIAIKF